MFRVFRKPAPLDTWVLSDESADSAAEVVPARGGILSRFRVGPTPVITCDDATLHDVSKSVRGGIPLLFPIAGRLSGDRYEWNGATYELKQHGFARNARFDVIGEGTDGGASLSLALESSPDTLRAFPFSFRLEVRYAVRGAMLAVTLSFENRSAEPMPLHAGLHPYFFVPDSEKRATRVATCAMRAFDNVTKRDVALTGLDLAAPEVDLHLVDHGSTASAIERPDGTSVEIEASGELARWVVWTLAGKDFVCVEPWTAAADALRTRDGLLFVAPNGRRVLGVEIRLGRSGGDAG